jgi:asparagine synthetase B (glutamine-hydrolysing)
MTMCGVVACREGWHHAELIALMMRAAERGPHGWGLHSSSGRTVALGRFNLKVPVLLSEGEPVIGHTRLATSAGRASLAALQPLQFRTPAGALFAVAHNGTVLDAPAWGVSWPTGNDSEVIGAWLAQQDGEWSDRLRELTLRLRQPYALAVWTAGAIWIMRRYHPLYLEAGRACSRPFGAARLIPQDDPVCL